VPVSRKRVRDVVRLSGEPLTVAFHARVHENRRVFPRCIDTSRRLVGVVALLDKIGFFHPSFRGSTVGHGEGTVAMSKVSANDVDPRGDDGCKEFE